MTTPSPALPAGISMKSAFTTGFYRMPISRPSMKPGLRPVHHPQAYPVRHPLFPVRAFLPVHGRVRLPSQARLHPLFPVQVSALRLHRGPPVHRYQVHLPVLLPAVRLHRALAHPAFPRLRVSAHLRFRVRPDRLHPQGLHRVPVPRCPAHLQAQARRSRLRVRAFRAVAPPFRVRPPAPRCPHPLRRLHGVRAALLHLPGPHPRLIFTSPISPIRSKTLSPG